MHAVQLADSIIGTAGLQEGELRTAAVTDSSGKEEPSCLPAAQKPKAAAAAAAAAKQPFKKGFLDARSRSSSKQVLSSSQVREPVCLPVTCKSVDKECGAHRNTVTYCGLLLCALVLCILQQQGRQSAGTSSHQQHVPLIKRQQQQAGSGKAVPDMFMLPPDEQQQRLSAMKSQLLSALQPTPDTVSAVAQDSTLMSGAAAGKVDPDGVVACMIPPTMTTATLLAPQALKTRK